jgi:hypothetical protein
MTVCLDASSIGACGIRDAKIAQTYADRFGPTVFSLPRNAASGYEGTQAAAVVRQPCKSHTRRLSRI